MSLKLLADKYIELNIKKISDINIDNFRQFSGVANNHIFLLCSFGEMKVILNKEEFSLKENDILLIPINSEYSILEGKFTSIFIAFNGASVDELIYCSVFKNQSFLSSDNNMAYYLYKIYHAYYEAEYLSIKCLGLLYEFFYEITKQSKIDSNDYTNKEKHIEMAKEFIIQNYQKEISISDVARKVGVTSNYLANIFALYNQKAPKLYLTEVRMEQAKKLLSTHKYKVKDVGKMVGYKNQLHFSSEFKKYTGLSPLNYAKKY